MDARTKDARRETPDPFIKKSHVSKSRVPTNHRLL